jgi:hypothetical protein
MEVIMEVNNFPNLCPTIESRGKANWKRLIKKVNHFSKGITVPGAVIMNDIHLRECYEIKLKLPEGELNVRLHPTKSFTYELLKNFKKMSQCTINFNEFLQHKIDKWCEKGKLAKIQRLIDGFKLVDYLPDHILSSLTPSFGLQGEIIMPNALLAQWTESMLMAKKNREINDGKLNVQTYREYYESMKGTTQDEMPLPAAEYIFVLTTDGQLRLAYKALNLYHSSLSRGGALLAAGKCYIENIDGLMRITRVEAYSGHYQPGLYELFNILEYLEKHGMNMDAIDFQIHEKNVQNNKIWKGNELKSEIKKRKELLLEEIRSISLGAYQLALTKPEWSFAKLSNFSNKAKNEASR